MLELEQDGRACTDKIEDMIPIIHPLHTLLESDIHIFPASLVDALCRHLDMAPSSAGSEDELHQLLCERLKEACRHTVITAIDIGNVYTSPCYEDTGRTLAERPGVSAEPNRMNVKSGPNENIAGTSTAPHLLIVPTNTDMSQGGDHTNNGSDSLANPSPLHTEDIRHTDHGHDSESPHFEARRQSSHDSRKSAEIGRMRSRGESRERAEDIGIPKERTIDADGDGSKRSRAGAALQSRSLSDPSAVVDAQQDGEGLAGTGVEAAHGDVGEHGDAAETDFVGERGDMPMN
jgi:hypothetical protein